jgi:hypothetical protein
LAFGAEPRRGPRERGLAPETDCSQTIMSYGGV